MSHKDRAGKIPKASRHKKKGYDELFIVKKETEDQQRRVSEVVVEDATNVVNKTIGSTGGKLSRYSHIEVPKHSMLFKLPADKKRFGPEKYLTEFHKAVTKTREVTVQDQCAFIRIADIHLELYTNSNVNFLLPRKKKVQFSIGSMSSFSTNSDLEGWTLGGVGGAKATTLAWPTPARNTKATVNDIVENFLGDTGTETLTSRLSPEEQIKELDQIADMHGINSLDALSDKAKTQSKEDGHVEEVTGSLFEMLVGGKNESADKTSKEDVWLCSCCGIRKPKEDKRKGKQQ